MTEINSVSGDAFPIIDFKFKNFGRDEASLHKFKILILDAEVDVTPLLSHEVVFAQDSTELNAEANGALALVTKNYGWGDAVDAVIQIESGWVSGLFSLDQRKFEGRIIQGSVCQILLDPSSMNAKIFDDMLSRKGEHKDIWASSLGCQRDKAIEFGSFNILARFKDVTGKEYILEPELWFNDRRDMWLSNSKFMWERSTNKQQQQQQQQQQCQMQQVSAQYYVSIEPERGPAEKTYSISHVVKGGETERFQVMIGSSKSCKLRLKFAFFVDGEVSVESDVFEIRIWLPRGMSPTWRSIDSYGEFGCGTFRDGDELLAKASGAPGWWMGDILESSFPFLKRKVEC